MSEANSPGDSRTAMALKPVTADGLIYFEVGVPIELRDAVERHHRNLNVLVQQLWQGGVSERAATAHLDVAMASYRQALETAAISIRSSKR